MKQVALGSTHSAAITEDGDLYLWGDNEYGQLGNGSFGNLEVCGTPVKVLEHVKQVSLREDWSAAITEDGNLYLWGRNNYGRLGDGTREDRSRPVKVLEHVAQVSLGENHSAAVQEDGTLWLWGGNGAGQLGDGTTEDRSMPVKVLEHVVQVSLGHYHSAAVQEDGTLWLWGSNSFGQLGDGTREVRSTPVKVLEHVKQVSLGYRSSAAVQEDGALWLWGDIHRDLNSADGRTTPVKVLEHVAQVSLEVGGHWQTSMTEGYGAAVQEDGTLWFWGYNFYGRLGSGDEGWGHGTPVKVLEHVKQVSLGGAHSAAVKEDGTLWLWGANHYGQVTKRIRRSKTPIKGLDHVVQVNLRVAHSAVVTEDGTLWSWTHNFGVESGPKQVLEHVAQVIFGNGRDAAVQEDGTLWLWGNNEYGQLGDGTREHRSTPVKVLEHVKQVSLEGEHSAALQEDGTLWLWGRNEYGQLGDGTSEDRLTPVKVLEHVKQVSLGESHSAALQEDGTLWLWGRNWYGQLGDGTKEDRSRPVKVLEHVKQVSLRRYHSAALQEDGTLWLWGNNEWGQLGDGTTEDRSRPVKVLERVKQVSLGTWNSAAVQEDGTLWLWGSNSYGKLGDGTTENRSRPVKALEHVAQISLGRIHTAAVQEDGTLWLWGNNELGQLGDGTTEDRSRPVKVLEHVKQVSLGDVHSAAMKEDGTLWLWGENTYGQFGCDSAAPKILEPLMFVLEDPVDESSCDHALTLVEAVEPTPEKTGNIAYYVCSKCGKKFADAEGKQELTDEDITLYWGLSVRLAGSGLGYTYTGKAIKPAVIVTNNGKRLTEGVDYTVKYANNVKASADVPEAKKPRVTVTGKGSLAGSASANFEIAKRDLADVTVCDTVVASGVKAVPLLYYDGVRLGAKDYEVKEAPAGQKYAQSGTMTVAGKGNFTGEAVLTITAVKKEDLRKFAVTPGKEPLNYDGTEKKVSFTVTDPKSREKLEEGKDYRVVYPLDLVNAGKVRFTVVGMGSYAGAVTKNYTIKPMAAPEGSILVSGVEGKSYEYKAGGVTVEGDISASWRKSDSESLPLTPGRDYKVTCRNNKKAGTAGYTLAFLGNYKGTKAKSGSFTITPAALNADTRGLQIFVADKAYAGKPGNYASKPYVGIDGVMLKAADYTVNYYRDEQMTQEITGRENLIAPEGDIASVPVYVKVTGRGNYAAPGDGQAWASAQYQVRLGEGMTDLSGARVTVVDAQGNKLTKLEYTGQPIEPAVKVEVKGQGGYTVVPADQYEVHYLDNVGKGRATVIVNAAGSGCVGGKTANFTIAPKNLKPLKDLWKDLGKSLTESLNERLQEYLDNR